MYYFIIIYTLITNTPQILRLTCDYLPYGYKIVKYIYNYRTAIEYKPVVEETCECDCYVIIN